MKVYHPADVFAAAPALIISDATTPGDVSSTYRSFGRLDEREIGGRRFQGRSPWERHPSGDELLFVADGEAELTLLHPAGEERAKLPTGALVVVPKGIWHRLEAARVATIWGVTHSADDEISFDEDPRPR